MDDITALAHALDTPASLRDRLRERARELRDELRANAGLELRCVAACETGELAGDIVAYSAGAQSMLPGLGLGVATGFAYALRHLRRDHGIASLRTAFDLAITTEIGCVGGATLTESMIMNAFAQGTAPTDPENMLLRLAGLPVAYGIGILAMSALTARKRRTTTGLVADAGMLDCAYEGLRDEIGTALAVERRRDCIRIAGSERAVRVTERSAPYGDRGRGIAFYRVATPVAPDHAAALEHATSLLARAFERHDVASRLPSIAAYVRAQGTSCTHHAHAPGHTH